jgi:microcystin synthetase protein McyG
VHAAGALKDAALANLTWEQVEPVLRAKVFGAWHLHRHTLHLGLDSFVLFSSIASVFGNAGQANHAAANLFLDSLAHYRRALGKPAIAINWGGWSQIGAAASRDVQVRLAERGIGMISPRQGVAALERICAENPVQMVVFPLDREALARADRDRPPVLSRLIKSAPVKAAVPGGLSQRLRQAPASLRRDLIEQTVRAEVARIIRAQSPGALSAHQGFFDMGMDSLMVVELRNELQAQLDESTRLPSTVVFEHPSITELTEYLSEELLPPSRSSDPIGTSVSDLPPDHLSDLSMDQLLSMLDSAVEEA